MKVCMFMADGFEEVEAIGTYAILRRAGLKVDLVALEDHDATGRFDLTCTNLKAISTFDPEAYAAIILPGGPGHKALESNDIVQKAIKTCYEEHKFICAICAAPTILGRLGYLQDKQYTCFTSMNADFGGIYVDQYVVRDENIITGRSAAASIDFGFAIVEALCGKEQANKTKAEIYYEVH